MIYKQATKSTEARVKDLLKRMTLDEKVAQLSALMPHMLLDGGSISNEIMGDLLKHGIGRVSQFPMPFVKSARQIAEAYNEVQKFVMDNTRLSIPIMAQLECLSGVTAVDATSFPSPIAMASTWEPSLIKKAGRITGQQMRAITNGSNALSPVVDLARDPRWGRVYETYGECPYINSEFGIAYTSGLQNDGDFKTGVQACAKHFLGYSYSQGGLNSSVVEIGSRELYDSFARPFEAMIHSADLRSLMVTYSEINGKPVSYSKEILIDLLREDMGFTGSAIPDGGSIPRGYNKQRSALSMQDAAVQAITAGLDADTPITLAYHLLPEAIKDKNVSIKVINKACARVLKQKFDLGLFDNPFVELIDLESKFGEKFDETSLEISRKSITLLKNKNKILPLSKNKNKIGVIGPHANSLLLLFGGYTFPAALELMTSSSFSMEGVNDAIEGTGGIKKINKSTGINLGSKDSSIEQYCEEKYNIQSILTEIKNKRGNDSVFYAQGCNIDDEDTSMFEEAIQTANKSDVIVLTLGGKCGWTEDATSGEAKDRASLKLPGVQEELLKILKKTGKPIILVLLNGRPMTINWATENIEAIIETWLPGPQGGLAIAETLFGDINPGGKLPVTFPRHEGQIPIYYNHKIGSGYDSLKSNETGSMFGGGYTDIPSTPLFPFGYGLSYTEFEFTDYDLSSYKVDINGKLNISAFVTNIGGKKGDEVVQFYIQDLEARVTRPVKELIGFKRISLLPGEMKKVTLELNMSQLGFMNEDMEFVVEPGNMKIMIGNSSQDIYFTDTFEITGKKKNLKGKRTYISTVGGETVKTITKTTHEKIIVKKNYSSKSTLQELLNDEEAKVLVLKHFGEEFMSNPHINKLKGMSLKMIKLLAGKKLPNEVLEALVKELENL